MRLLVGLFGCKIWENKYYVGGPCAEKLALANHC
jgi:hypothetical protein